MFTGPKGVDVHGLSPVESHVVTVGFLSLAWRGFCGFLCSQSGRWPSVGNSMLCIHCVSAISAGTWLTRANTL